LQDYAVVAEFASFEKPKLPRVVLHNLFRHPERYRGSREDDRVNP